MSPLTVNNNLDAVDRVDLERLARRYIWWKTPDATLAWPDRLVARVMDIGDFDDIQFLNEAIGDVYFIRVLKTSEIGQFRPQSWTYWHYRLGLAEPGHVPPMPTRRLG